MSKNAQESVTYNKLLDKMPIPLKILLYGILVLFGLACLIPFLMLISSSFASEDYIIEKGFPVFPVMFNFDAYQFISIYSEKILIGYKMSLIATIGGTLLNVIFSVMLAYPLSNMNFRYRSVISFFVFFTMMFGGGLIPTYILIKRYLGLGNTIWALILPGVVQPGNIFLLRIFMQNTPKEVYESARIDGAGEYTILWKMVMPLTKSGIAAVTLFFVLGYWGDVVTPRLYIDARDKIPLPLLLDGLANSVGRPVGTNAAGTGVTLTTAGLFAMCLIAAGPMVFIFQFFQKYFVEGLVMGSVKG